MAPHARRGRGAQGAPAEKGEDTMIVDQLANIGRYRGFQRGLDELIDWLASHDPRELEAGCHEIDGQRVFANVMEPTTRPESEAHYEVHARYYDVQVDLSGREAWQVSQGATTEVAAFDEGQDFGLCDAASCVRGDLDEGRFAVFVPGEPHMPTLQFGNDGARKIKKVCFKVLADAHWDELPTE